MSQIPREFFHDPDENVKGILGQNYITSVVMERSFSKSIMVLTNKRLYQQGKIYERVGKKFISRKGTKVVQVKDITGTLFVEKNRVFAKWVGIFCLVLGVIIETEPRWYLIGAAFIGWYLLHRKRLFVVEYAGGAIATESRLYTPEIISNFQKNIHLIKDEY